MTGTTIGTLVSAAGSVLGIYGGWVLYANSAPEHGMGVIPSISGDSTEFFQNQRNEIAARQRGTRYGFLLITLGAVLQFFGTLIAGFLK